jgi:hypothetical protein
MASSGKRKTTMAKLSRENKKLEKRAEKAARAAARKRGELDSTPDDGASAETEEAWQLTRGLTELEG